MIQKRPSMKDSFPDTAMVCLGSLESLGFDLTSKRFTYSMELYCQDMAAVKVRRGSRKFSFYL